MDPEVKITPAQELPVTAAAEVLSQARAAVQASGTFTLVLAGGSTPRLLYSLLADKPSFRAEMPWEKTHFFWGDERHVPPDHPDSNYRMAHEAMLSKVPVPPANVHRIRSENPDAAVAADDYEHELRQFFHLAERQLPRFDLVLLGMGTDGHTASLFPGTKALVEKKRLVSANWVEKLNTWRITLTAPVLSHAACVAFLVSGPDKAEPLRVVLRGQQQPELYPSQLIRPSNGRLIWLLDESAARLLERGRDSVG
jgi:6-phosphogluconolactonase